MAKVIEYEGKTVDKALASAANELGKTVKEIKYDVISYGSTGIFGLVGAKKAKIRVVLPEKKPEKITEKRTDDHKKLGDEKIERVEQKSPASNEQQIEAPPDDKNDGLEKAENRIEPATATKTENAVEPGQLAQLAALGTEGLNKITQSITDDSEVAVTQKNGKLSYTITGGNSAVLIGKRGQTLEAIQYLIDKIINKSSSKRVKVEVDVEGYREKRKANLRKMAKRLAEKVRKSGKPVSAGQMNSHDRRIVHLTLKGDHSVRTQSMGDGHIRKLVIFPKGGNNRQRKAGQS